jgi:hypothetical protein
MPSPPKHPPAQGLGVGNRGCGCGDWVLGVWGSGMGWSLSTHNIEFGVWGFAIWGSGLGFGVWGFGGRVVAE